MDKINFKNLPDTTTPLNADILMQLQDNIDNAKLENTHKTITDWNTAVETTLVATGPGILNGPDGVDYAGGFILKRGTHIIQVAVASRTGVLYTRASLNGTDWEEWVDYPNTLNGKLERYTGSLNDINRTCNLVGFPCTDYPSGAGSGWGVITTMKATDTTMLQIYFDRALSGVYYRFKQNSVWEEWNGPLTAKPIKYSNGKLSDTVYATKPEGLEVGGTYEVAIVRNYNTSGNIYYRGVIYGILSLPCGFKYNGDGTVTVVVRPKFNIIANYNGPDSTEDTRVKVVCEGDKTEIDVNTFRANPKVYIQYSNSTYLQIEKVNIRKISI